MNDHDLVAKARDHLKKIIELDDSKLTAEYALTADMFTRISVSQVPVVSFACKDREDVIQIFLDPTSGDFIDACHIPKPPKPEAS